MLESNQQQPGGHDIREYLEHSMYAFFPHKNFHLSHFSKLSAPPAFVTVPGIAKSFEKIERDGYFTMHCLLVHSHIVLHGLQSEQYIVALKMLKREDPRTGCIQPTILMFSICKTDKRLSNCHVLGEPECTCVWII